VLIGCKQEGYRGVALILEYCLDIVHYKVTFWKLVVSLSVEMFFLGLFNYFERSGNCMYHFL